MTSPTTLNPVPPPAAGSQLPARASGLAQVGNSDVSANTFLQLLVAEIKNQDPLQPMQGTEFITQLAQFNSLAQLIAIKDELQPPPPAATGSGSGNVPTGPAASPAAGASAAGAGAAGVVSALLPGTAPGAVSGVLSGAAAAAPGPRSNGN
ncbi:MAG TPA: flagellar hook capping FlgD N-terminal domain-containing protein [Bryobacterales bacterium]|nr:flagellar hook capping FlgD N-terminal domain-containing protein [Bryobacterales bacterium]